MAAGRKEETTEAQKAEASGSAGQSGLSFVAVSPGAPVASGTPSPGSKQEKQGWGQDEAVLIGLPALSGWAPQNHGQDLRSSWKTQ